MVFFFDAKCSGAQVTVIVVAAWILVDVTRKFYYADH